MELLVSLDYDDTPRERVEGDALYLFATFKLPIMLYRSSEASYHLRFHKPIEEDLAFRILRASKCSLDYKNFCRRVRMFPIRIGEKRRFREGKLVEIRPAPELIKCFL